MQTAENNCHRNRKNMIYLFRKKIIMLDGFNVRVYAVCLRDGKLLVLHEPFMGHLVVKLPGGGLEYGEGPVDCLVREFREELGLEVEVKESFYIQERFVPSLAKNNKQIVMLYFMADILNPEALEIKDSVILKADWVPVTEACPLTLPVDRQMYEKLKRYVHHQL